MIRFASLWPSASRRPAPISNASSKRSPPRSTRANSFILFAAGHGTSAKCRFYLIPQDYQSGPPGSLADAAIGQDELQDWLANRIRAKRAIILLDTCESGALVAGHARSRVGGPASEAAVGRLHEATGRPVLTAAAVGQFAHEGLIAAPGERHGVFTWAVLDALRKGDANGNGLIEFSELVAHVQSVVPKVAAEMGGTGRAATASPYRRWWRAPRQPGDGRSVAMGEGGGDKGASTEPAIAPVPGRADMLSS